MLHLHPPVKAPLLLCHRCFDPTYLLRVMHDRMTCQIASALIWMSKTCPVQFTKSFHFTKMDQLPVRRMLHHDKEMTAPCVPVELYHLNLNFKVYMLALI